MDLAENADLALEDIISQHMENPPSDARGNIYKTLKEKQDCPKD